MDAIKIVVAILALVAAFIFVESIMRQIVPSSPTKRSRP